MFFIFFCTKGQAFHSPHSRTTRTITQISTNTNNSLCGYEFFKRKNHEQEKQYTIIKKKINEKKKKNMNQPHHQTYVSLLIRCAHFVEKRLLNKLTNIFGIQSPCNCHITVYFSPSLYFFCYRTLSFFLFAHFIYFYLLLMNCLVTCIHALITSLYLNGISLVCSNQIHFNIKISAAIHIHKKCFVDRF